MTSGKGGSDLRLKWVAWSLWWAAGVGVLLWWGPVFTGVYLIVSGVAGAAFARR